MALLPFRLRLTCVLVIPMICASPDGIWLTCTMKAACVAAPFNNGWVTTLIATLAIIAHNVASRVAGELLIPSSSRRIAAIVLRIASPDTAEARVGSDGIVVTQWQVAEMANVSRNVANGVLCRLRHDGWIETRYGRVTVRDRAALAAYAYGED